MRFHLRSAFISVSFSYKPTHIKPAVRHLTGHPFSLPVVPAEATPEEQSVSHVSPGPGTRPQLGFRVRRNPAGPRLQDVTAAILERAEESRRVPAKGRRYRGGARAHREQATAASVFAAMRA